MAPHAQGSHQNTLIIGLIGTFFVSTLNSEVMVCRVRTGFTFSSFSSEELKIDSVVHVDPFLADLKIVKNLDTPKR